MAESGTIGQRVPRPDAAARATGRAVFADDISLPGMLWGAVARCPHAHARLVRLDLERATQVPGVRAVAVPGQCPLFCTQIQYAGQKVAAVAAVDRHTAEQAVALLDVHYEVLPAVFDALEAMEPGAPEVRPSRLPGRRNVCSHQRKERGDVDAGFAAAAVVVEETYRIGAAHQGYLEPHACVARPEADGTLTVWTCVQGQFHARAALAQALGLPLHRLRVIAPEVGGAFGGKTALILEPIAAWLALRTGAPVKMVMSRREVFADSHPGAACVVRVRTGADAEGHLVAEEAEVVYDTGAAPGAPAGSFDRCRGLYRIPHFRYDLYSVYTHKVVPGAYRAPGAVELTFAFESQMDALACRLGLDPVELRLCNAVDEGDLTVDGARYPAIGLRQSLLQARRHVAQLERRAHVGVGVACGKWMNAVGASAVFLLLDEDGSLSITSGAVDLTGVNTALAQVAAQELGVPLDRVRVVTRGTDAAPFVAITGGSRTAYGTTLALCRALDSLKDQLRHLASGALAVPADTLRVAGGQVRSADGRACASVADLASLATRSPCGPLTASGSASAETWLADSHIFITQVAEVEVDADTGLPHVLRVTVFQDVGRALNPLLVEGQIEGGAVQGMGWGLLEDLVFDRGIVLNDGFLDYRMPTAVDAPEVTPVLLEVPSPHGPYGVKGAGEPSMVATPAALAAALRAATGRRPTQTPLVRRAEPEP